MAHNHCSSAETPYAIRHTIDSIVADTECANVIGSPNNNWVERCLLPRIIKWSGSFQNDNSIAGTETSRVESLGLIDLEEYNELYNELKLKYGLDMVKVDIQYFKTSIITYFSPCSDGLRKRTLQNLCTKTLPLQHILFCCGVKKDKPTAAANYNRLSTWDAEMVCWFIFCRLKDIQAWALI